MNGVEELLDSLLYEGYALYPYTPGAAKNATPTPFGIVYPPDYVRTNPSAFDHLQVECLLLGDKPEVDGEVRFLQSTGERHEATERRAGPGPFAFEPLRGRVELEIAEAGDGSRRVRLRVVNEAPFDGDGRAEALGRSLLSTHVVLRARGGRFVSPLEADGCVNVNTWPVLASPGDDVIVGAAILLPDHPRIAPESGGSLFDGTEVEEALLLHVHALSDAERETIAGQDERVRAMVDRASETGPEDVMRLHGVMRPVDDDPRLGEPEADVDGTRLRPGDKVVLRLGHRDDVYDRMLDGRTATLERIYRDHEDRVYLGVTVDSDPMQEIFRDTGRYLFFFAGEVEALPR